MAQNRNAALRIVFGADTQQLDKAMANLSRKLTTVGKSMAGAGRTLSRNLTAPLAAVGAISIKTATDFEFAMAKVQAVSGFTAREMDDLSASARDFGARTAFSASEVAGLQKELAKLGFSANEIIDLTDGTLSLAQAFDMELGDAAEKVALNLNRFGLEASEAGRVADVMAVAFGSSALDAEKLNESLKMVGPVAKQSGFQIEQTAGILGVLANQGLSGSMAGVGLQKVFVTLAKEGKNVKDGFAELLRGSLTTEEAFERFGDRAGKLIPLLQQNSGEIALLTDKLYDSEGAAAAARAAMEDTTQGALKRMKSGLEAAGIAIGTALLPTFQKLVDFVINLAEKFNSLAPAQQRIILGVAAFAAAIGPLLVMSGSLVTAFGALSGAAATLGLSLTAALGPIGVVIGLIAGGLALAYNQAGNEAAELKARQDALNKSLEGIPEAAKPAAGRVKELQRKLTELNGALDENSKRGIIRFEDILDEELRTELMALRDELNATDMTWQQANERLASYVRGAILVNQADEELARSAAAAAAAEAERTAAVTDAKMALDEFQDTQNALKEAGEGLAMSQESYLRGLRQKWQDYAKAQVLAGQDSQAAQAEIKAIDEQLKGLTSTIGEATAAFKLSDPLSDYTAKLSEQVLQIEAAFSVTGKQEKRLHDLANAYQQAAIQAAVLGDMAMADELNAEAKAYELQAQKADQAKQSKEQLLDSMFKLGFQASELASMSIPELLAALEEYKVKAKDAKQTTSTVDQAFTSFADNLRGALLNSIDAFAQGIGAAVEEARASGEKMRSIGNIAKQTFAGVLDALGGILVQVGKAAILTGTAVKGIKKALQSLNPAVAIAAGVAFIALSAAIRGGLSRAAEGGGGGGVPRLARGGITTGETLALIGDNPSGKEAIIPFERMGEFLQMAGANQTQHTIVTGRLQGMDILLSNNRAQIARNRTT